MTTGHKNIAVFAFLCLSVSIYSAVGVQFLELPLANDQYFPRSSLQNWQYMYSRHDEQMKPLNNSKIDKFFNWLVSKGMISSNHGAKNSSNAFTVNSSTPLANTSSHQWDGNSSKTFEGNSLTTAPSPKEENDAGRVFLKNLFFLVI